MTFSLNNAIIEKQVYAKCTNILYSVLIECSANFVYNNAKNSGLEKWGGRVRVNFIKTRLKKKYEYCFDGRHFKD